MRHLVGKLHTTVETKKSDQTANNAATVAQNRHDPFCVAFLFFVRRYFVADDEMEGSSGRLS